MDDLFWPGDARAGDRFTSAALLDAMARVEGAWLRASGRAVALDLQGLVGPEDLRPLAAGSEGGGNPVMGMVALLRDRLSEQGADEAARWLHRGLTSQDVLDSALMLLLREVVADVRGDLRAQVDVLAALARTHRGTPMVARTLTQHAVPTTFGLRVSTWLTGLLDVYDDLAGLAFPVQLGGAAGTLAAVVELGIDPATARRRLGIDLDLAAYRPWHTTRRPVTRIGDALVACTDAWARVANDVLTSSRPEIGELSEGAGGGSSTMPHKANPVLSVLVRRAALTTPPLAATLHLAAADQGEERAAGGWHAEWGTLAVLARRVLVAGSQTTDLLSSLQVHPDRMRATLEASLPDALAEQRTMAEVAGHPPHPTYLGQADQLVDAALRRAEETQP